MYLLNSDVVSIMEEMRSRTQSFRLPLSPSTVSQIAISWNVLPNKVWQIYKGFRDLFAKATDVNENFKASDIFDVGDMIETADGIGRVVKIEDSEEWPICVQHGDGVDDSFRNQNKIEEVTIISKVKV